jgi:hypothetical protein
MQETVTGKERMQPGGISTAGCSSAGPAIADKAEKLQRRRERAKRFGR